MKNTIVHHEGAASLKVAVNKIGLCGSVIKIGLDVHARLYVAVAQYDQLLPKPARRLAPTEFVPWVPSEAEEQARHVSRQREQLVRHRQKLEAQGRSLLINHSLPAPAHWWKNQTWSRLSKLLPAWICLRLEVHRPALLTLEQQISALNAELEAAAPADVPAGVGKLTTVVMTREICSWERFSNRRAISSYTGLCPGEHSSGSKRVPGSVTKHGNPRLRAALVECAWRMVRFQPNYQPVKKRLSVLAKGSHATGAQRKKAIVAVARHLAVDLWRVHTGRNTAAQLGLTI